MQKLAQLDHLNSKETSTQLDNIKIEGCKINDMTMLHSSTVLMIFVGNNGLMSLDHFDLIDEAFSFRSELVPPRAYLPLNYDINIAHDST